MSRVGLWTERADSSEMLPPWVRRQSEARYEWACHFVRGAVVLDAACGTGYGARVMRLNGGASFVVGLDLETDVVALASRRFAEVSSLWFCAGSVTSLPFADNTFDVYVSFETIEHIEDVERFVSEAWRVLKPGGTLLVSTPNRLVTNPQLPRLAKPMNPFHVREFDPSELLDLFGPPSAGQRLWAMCRFPRGYMNMIRRLPRLWTHFPGRVHQGVKVFFELLGRYPTCTPVSVGPAACTNAEYLLLECRRGVIATTTGGPVSRAA